MNGVAMNTFTIDTINNLAAIASLDEARAPGDLVAVQELVAVPLLLHSL
jgi:hypothetical protein